MEPAIRSISEYGLGIVGVVALAMFAFWLLRQYLESLKAESEDTRKERDEAVAGWRAQTSATDKLADRIADLERSIEGRRP